MPATAPDGAEISDRDDVLHGGGTVTITLLEDPAHGPNEPDLTSDVALVNLVCNMYGTRASYPDVHIVRPPQTSISMDVGRPYPERCDVYIHIATRGLGAIADEQIEFEIMRRLVAFGLYGRFCVVVEVNENTPKLRFPRTAERQAER